MRLRLEQWASPLSSLLLVTDEEGFLRALDFADHEARMARLLHRHYGVYTLRRGAAPASITTALKAYFNGDMDALAAIRTATIGTPFQREVWNALRAIPSGATVSYGQLAATIGRDGASRAVGAANGANPIAIVVPCHRVIGTDRALTGFAGGLARKRWLLDHERRFAQGSSFAGSTECLVGIAPLFAGDLGSMRVTKHRTVELRKTHREGAKWVPSHPLIDGSRVKLRQTCLI